MEQWSPNEDETRNSEYSALEFARPMSRYRFLRRPAGDISRGQCSGLVNAFFPLFNFFFQRVTSSFPAVISGRGQNCPSSPLSTFALEKTLLAVVIDRTLHVTTPDIPTLLDLDQLLFTLVLLRLGVPELMMKL